MKKIISPPLRALFGWIAHAATACVMALEAWAKFAKPGEEFGMTEVPSEAFDPNRLLFLMVTFTMNQPYRKAEI